MPKAIEIRVDPVSKCVVIDTNFPNREVQGASWEPQLFHLGWETPEEIWEAMHETVPTMICYRMRLSSGGRVVACAYDFTDEVLIQTLLHYADTCPADTVEKLVATVSEAIGVTDHYQRTVKPPLDATITEALKGGPRFSDYVVPVVQYQRTVKPPLPDPPPHMKPSTVHTTVRVGEPE